MKFTRDYFTHNIELYQNNIDLLANKTSILELGSYEGRSAIWFYENLLADPGTITCVDCFTYPNANCPQTASKLIEKSLRYNLACLPESDTKTVNLVVMDSCQALCDFIQTKESFELIYIDGSHTAPDALTDMVLSFRCLTEGGIMIVDDYEKQHESGVKLAADLFYKSHQDLLQIVDQDYQIIFQKVRSDTSIFY